MATKSGYSAEDLVSNLIGFYGVIYPSKRFISIGELVSKKIALDIWDKYGAVGDNKNFTTVPFTYPIPPSTDGPMSLSLPPELDAIKPAKIGYLL